MEDVRRQLDRLRRGWRRTRARDLAGRAHLALVVLAILVVFSSRLFGPWPVVGLVEGDFRLALLVTAVGAWRSSTDDGPTHAE